MSKRAAAAQQERQKVQLVSCPCCEARLALHFVHGSNEVYDVELVAPSSSSRKKDDDDDDDENTALEATTPIRGRGPVSSPCSSISESPASSDPPGNSPGSSKLFPLFYRPKKTVHLVRHGHTASLIGLENASDRFDLRLTSLGHQQARGVAPKLALLKPQVIFVSPLTRALQTLCGAFPSAQETSQPRVQVTPLHAEHVMCSGDVGRPPQVLAGEYPWLSFDALPEVWWYSQPKHPNDAMKMEFNSVEPMEELRKRVGVFRQFLRFRPENVIVVIGHSTFFKELTSTRQRMMNCEIKTLML